MSLPQLAGVKLITDSKQHKYCAIYHSSDG